MLPSPSPEAGYPPERIAPKWLLYAESRGRLLVILRSAPPRPCGGPGRSFSACCQLPLSLLEEDVARPGRARAQLSQPSANVSYEDLPFPRPARLFQSRPAMLAGARLEGQQWWSPWRRSQPMMGHARLWKPVLPFLMDEGAARAFGGLRGSRRGFSDGGAFAPSARGGGHDVNRTLYKFCENTSVLISYSLKAHVSPGHASSSGRGSGENMALGLRKLFLSDPGGRLRARDEQIGFARARITKQACLLK